METKVAIIKDIQKDVKFIEEAAQTIVNGGIVAFPTETVYGLGANALDEKAVEKIFIAKGRPQDNPLIVHVSSNDISDLVKEVPDVAKKLMDKFWPGPLTIILEKKDIIPNVTSANLNTIGIRMPNCEIALKLIEISKRPIAAPSANISGRPSPTEVERCIEDLNGRVDYIIGGESSDIGVESTIIDCTVNPPMILRPGGITLEMLREVDSNICIDEAIKSKPTDNIKPKAPGMKYRHYAPNTKCLLVYSYSNDKLVDRINQEIELEKNVLVLGRTSNLEKYNTENKLDMGDTLEEISKNIFTLLRKVDSYNVELVIIEGVKKEGLGLAIMNRLIRACEHNYIEI